MLEYFLAPFLDYAFLRRALIATLAISLSCAPIGVLLILRRMSLMGDALSHAVLPGIAIGYLITGLWLPALSAGGLIAGLLVAIAGGLVSRHTILTEDASFTGFYLIALALGVLILSVYGGQMNLLHLLFGSVLAVDTSNLVFIAFTTSLTLFIIAFIYRPLIYECFDPLFMRIASSRAMLLHLIFLALVVMNLVAACQAIGTLMALGMMMLPAITARLWAKQVWSLFLLAIIFAIVASYCGLLFSYHYNWPSGPTIVLMGGVLYIASLLCIARTRVSFN
ncbi:MAG: metal ABC transporter permease [Alphaproteobacteria bacterium]